MCEEVWRWDFLTIEDGPQAGAPSRDAFAMIGCESGGDLRQAAAGGKLATGAFEPSLKIRVVFGE